jgi:uncharacterized surface protein with fasciclin (FAS1) repeats
MTTIKNIPGKQFLVIAGFLATLSSCNKDVEQFADIPVAVSGARALADTISVTPTDSLFGKIITKSGLAATLNNKSNTYTLFAPDNAALIASFGGSLAAANATINSFSAATCAGIVSYNLLPQKFPTSLFPETFPNRQVPTSIILDPTNPLIRSTMFLSKRGATYYANNIPLGVMDLQAANGIIHKPLRLIQPPTATLKSAMVADSNNIAIFTAAVLRADSGQVGLNRFDSLLNYGVTNMTVLAPRDTAFKTLINALSGGLIPLGAPRATFIAFLNNPAFVTAATARGIIAYHFLASAVSSTSFQPNFRAFSVNFPTTPALYKTLVNNSVASHPGVMISSSFTGPFATAMQFAGVGTVPSGGAPFSAPANAVALDKQGVNGVYYIIDKVLLPQ